MFKERFSSRLGFVLSMMGIAVGAGNIWRFPRIVAQNGNGSFLCAWFLFLFAWSIPLIIIELSIGKITKTSPIEAIAKMAGRKFAWMGAFITLVTTGILAYYSVVVSWGVRYFIHALSGNLLVKENLTALWSSHSSGYETLLIHGLILTLSFFIIHKSISKGIELCNKILIPGFFICIALIFIRAVTLPHAAEGIKQLFSIDIQALKQYKTWMEALTQNAWDTGAGWGLLLVYAGFAPKEEGVVTNGSVTAIANNVVSLIMGVILFSVVSSLDQNGIFSLIKGEGSSGLGLTFIYLPRLFSQISRHIPLQILFSSLFFLAFTMAALSSMISMLLLLAKTLERLGLKRIVADISACSVAFLLGIPSALSLDFFQNQDTIWSVALILNGLFITFTAARFGVNSLIKRIDSFSKNDFHISRKFSLFIKFVIPLQGCSLLLWFFKEEFSHSQNPWSLNANSPGNIILQWSLPLILFILFNKRLSKN